jgi:hypothetical protein
LEQNAALRAAIRGTTFYIASHHGHSSGFSTELYEAMGTSPFLNLVSVTDGDEHVDDRYSAPEFARGAMVDGETRYRLTTRFDGSIVIDVNAQGQFLVRTYLLPAFIPASA